MNQAKPLSANQLEQAFEVFNRVSHELDTSYRVLESKVAGLTSELAAARSARLRELAEKERLAHRLSSLLSVLPGGVLIVDGEQVIRDANPAALELLGEPLIGQPWSQALAQASVDTPAQQPELQLKSGRHVSVTSRTLDDSGDQVVLITDVSNIHRLQEQLERKKRLTALGEMAARLAHQIRTPLSSTTLYLSQLSRQDLPAQQRSSISSKLSERLGHMGKLVDSMLSFVRGATPNSEYMLLNDVLRSFEATVRPQLEAAGARLVVPEVDDTLAIMGDADELAGALCNLAMNAMEAVGVGDMALDIWVGALNQDWLQLRVRDNGPGITAEVIERIFDPFFTTRAQGTGLGLAVVAMTVGNHGGEISVQNRPGGGAEFIINLPIAKQVETAAALQPDGKGE